MSATTKPLTAHAGKFLAIMIMAAIAFISPQAAHGAKSNVEIADSAYNKRDYSLALQYYKKALGHDGTSSDLYFNIGNTYYRLGSLGQAVIAYERALKIDPSNSQARLNLEFVKTRITDRPEDDSSFLSNLHNKIVAKFSPDTWAWIAFGVFAVLMALVALYIFTANITVRKIGFFSAIVMVAVFAYTLVIAYSTAHLTDSHDTAVVIVPTTNLSSTPSTPKDKADKVVPIHEGTKVAIIDSLATPDDPNTMMWYHVKINNTTSAWVSGADIERI